MVWGMLTSSGPGPLYRVRGSMNAEQYSHVIKNIMSPSARNLFGNNYIFQQDNAPCHKAKSVMELFKKEEINVLHWPAQSPDLSPIENIWREVGIGLQNHHPSNLDELYDAIKNVWYSIKPEKFEKLVLSFPQRLRACYAAHGGHTKY